MNSKSLEVIARFKAFCFICCSVYWVVTVTHMAGQMPTLPP